MLGRGSINILELHCILLNEYAFRGEDLWFSGSEIGLSKKDDPWLRNLSSVFDVQLLRSLIVLNLCFRHYFYGVFPLIDKAV